jgi:hypothetical protein
VLLLKTAGNEDKKNSTRTGIELRRELFAGVR